MVGSYWVCHWKKTLWVGGCDGIRGLAYLLFCAAYWSRQPRVFWRLSRSCSNTLRPRQNGRHFADDVFKCIFFNENVWISLKISLKFVPKGPINNIPSLVQIMAWHRMGGKPLSEPVMVRLLTHICVTRPQWVKAISHQHHGFSNYWQLIWLFNSLCRMTTKKTSNIHITVPSRKGIH